MALISAMEAVAIDKSSARSTFVPPFWKGVTWALAGFGTGCVCVFAGMVGGALVRHLKASPEITYADFIVIILTALAVILAALTLFIGVLALLGWSAISRGALAKAEDIIRSELLAEGKLRKVVTEEIQQLQYRGIESIDEDGAGHDGDGE